MRHHILPLIALAAFLSSACQREPGLPEETDPSFSQVSVSIGEDTPREENPGTRSLISVEAEKFRDAFLFAFDAATGKVLTYPEHAGDLEGSGPVAIYTTRKIFNWALPVGVEMDIWAVVNPGSGETASFLKRCASDASLRESDLYGDRLLFRCESGTRLKELDSSDSGIPMSGRMDGVRLSSASDGLSVRVRRLFAKYNIYFDTSAYAQSGYTVKSTYLMASKSNTEVPFFWDGGYTQTDYSKLATVDRSTEADLETLDGGGQVTLYFLENCQGDKSGASSWSTVYSDLGPDAVKLCSYMEVGVNVSRASDGTDASFTHRIYLGKTDMTTNFDVERNLFKTLKLFLRPDEGIVPGGDVEGFVFTPANSLSVAPGESVTIPFETTLPNSEIAYLVERSGSVSSDLVKTGSTYESSNKTGRYPNMTHSGTVTFTASASAAEGTLELTGGRDLGSESAVRSTVQVTIQEPVVLDVAYEAQKRGSYCNEWSTFRLPEASSSSPVTAKLTMSEWSTQTKTVSCGGSNAHDGNILSGLWWDASSNILYVSSSATLNSITLTQDGHQATVIDYNLRRPFLGPDMEEADGNSSVTYNDGVAHVVLDDSGYDSYIQIAPFDPVTGGKISGDLFAIPPFVSSNAYYPFECGMDVSDDNVGSPKRFKCQILSGDDHAFDLGSVKLAGLEACSESEGYFVDVTHTEFFFSDCKMKITVKPYSFSKDLGTFHNTQVATGQDVGCTVSVPFYSSSYEIRRYVYGDDTVHPSPDEASWASDRTESAEASIALSNGFLTLNPIGTDQGRYPCGTYLVRTRLVNKYNNAVRYGYYMFDLILDINIIPNFIFNFDGKVFTPRSGYYDYSHDVAGYNIGLTYHCPLARKGSSFVEAVAPAVVAQFEYEDTYGATGPQLIKGYEGLFEEDYNGPKSRTMTFQKDISWSGTVDAQNDYWKTNYWVTNKGGQYIFSTIFEMNEGGYHAGYNEFNWFFNNRNDSSATMDVLLGNSNWSKSQDSGFYHIGKVTDTIIEMSYDDGWLHY